MDKDASGVGEGVQLDFLLAFLPANPQKKPKTQIYMDLSYIDPQETVLNYCYKH